MPTTSVGGAVYPDMDRRRERKEIIQLTAVPGETEMQVPQARHVGRRGRVLDDR
jgi:hypothetical protein